jgi:LEA14-like dessication related protein
MKLPRFFLVVAALMTALLAGCSGRGRPGGVTVSLVDFRPTEAALLESRGTLTLRYTNENISPLGFSSAVHKLYLNGSYVGLAVSDQPFGIPPMNSTTQEVTMNLENLALVRQLIAVRDSQTVAYRLDSVLHQTIYEEKYEIKTRAEGAIDLRALTAAPVAP